MIIILSPVNQNKDLIITPTSAAEDSVLAQHFYQLWLDNDVTPDSIDDDWLEVTLNFIAKARQELSFQAFVGKIDNKIVASVSCQLFAGLYPSIFNPNIRQYGVIFGIFLSNPLIVVKQ